MTQLTSVTANSTYDEVVAFAKSIGIDGVGKMKKVEILAVIDQIMEEESVSASKPGRPVDPTSEHYQRKQELLKKQELGELKRGRPVDPNSARQTRIAGKEGDHETPGRPIDPNSERQKRLASMEAKAAKGLLRQGRPTDPTSARQMRLLDQMKRKVDALKGSGALKEIVAEVKANAKAEAIEAEKVEVTA